MVVKVLLPALEEKQCSVFSVICIWIADIVLSQTGNLLNCTCTEHSCFPFSERNLQKMEWIHLTQMSRQPYHPQSRVRQLQNPLNLVQEGNQNCWSTVTQEVPGEKTEHPREWFHYQRYSMLVPIFAICYENNKNIGRVEYVHNFSPSIFSCY